MYKEQEMTIEHDKQLDVCIAHLKKVTHPLETEVSSLFDGNILFKVDSITGELVQVFIYDFSIIRRKLFMKLIFLYTSEAIKNWLQVLITSFSAGQHANSLVHH